MRTDRAAVAVFDFDGTLVRGDSLLPFLAHIAGRRALLAAAWGSRRRLALLPLGGSNRDRAKEALLSRCLAGMPAAMLSDAARAYAAGLRTRLRPDVVARLRWHRQQGHDVVVVSASPELYVRPVVETLGVRDVLATQLEIEDGTVTGRLLGANVRGEEKVRRLNAWLDGEKPLVFAYGDSAGDRPLLAMADIPTWVSRRRLPAEPATRPLSMP